VTDGGARIRGDARMNSARAHVDRTRAGWVGPRRPGPTRALLIRCAVIGALLLVAGWAYGARMLETHALTDTVQRVTRSGSPVPAAHGLYESDGAYWVALQDDVPASSARRVDVVVASPIDIDAADASIRAWSADAIVTLGRSSIDEPIAHVKRLARRGVIHLLLVRPATPAEETAAARAAARPLASAARLFDRRVGDSNAAARSLDQLRAVAPWLLPLLLLLTVGLPLGVALVMRRTWFAFTAPAPQQAAPTGPPGSASALAATFASLGTRAVDVGDAFAAQVLDLVQAGTIDARPGVDSRRRPALMLRITRRPEQPTVTETAALDVLELATPGDATSLLVADGSPALTPVVAREMAATWRGALASAQVASKQVESPPWRWWQRAGQLLSIVLVVAVVVALRADYPGSAARWWVVLAAGAAAAYAVRQIEQELRSWRRVPASARVGRAQWLAWHAVLAGLDPPAVDARSLPYAAGSGLASDLAPEAVAVGALGLDGVTRGAIEALAGLVTA
jgi:hypothetical protein